MQSRGKRVTPKADPLFGKWDGPPFFKKGAAGGRTREQTRETKNKLNIFSVRTHWFATVLGIGMRSDRLLVIQSHFVRFKFMLTFYS